MTFSPPGFRVGMRKTSPSGPTGCRTQMLGLPAFSSSAISSAVLPTFSGSILTPRPSGGPSWGDSKKLDTGYVDEIAPEG